MAPGFNTKSPTMKRIMKEAAELSQHPSPDYTASPASDTDLFDWHFTLRGPPSSSFAGGIYHGRIVLPPQYPLRPPSFRFLTPSGRFEVNREICLSISGHHEETWQPAWGIRTSLVALRSFMETSPAGQLGGVDASDSVRKRIAGESRGWKCGVCGGKSCEEILGEAEQLAKEFEGEGVSFKTEEATVPPEIQMGYKKETIEGKEASRNIDEWNSKSAEDTSSVERKYTPASPAQTVPQPTATIPVPPQILQPQPQPQPQRQMAQAHVRSNDGVPGLSRPGYTGFESIVPDLPDFLEDPGLQNFIKNIHNAVKRNAFLKGVGTEWDLGDAVYDYHKSSGPVHDKYGDLKLYFDQNPAYDGTSPKVGAPRYFNDSQLKQRYHDLFWGPHSIDSISKSISEHLGGTVEDQLIAFLTPQPNVENHVLSGFINYQGEGKKDFLPVKNPLDGYDRLHLIQDIVAASLSFHISIRILKNPFFFMDNPEEFLDLVLGLDQAWGPGNDMDLLYHSIMYNQSSGKLIVARCLRSNTLRMLRPKEHDAESTSITKTTNDFIQLVTSRRARQWIIAGELTVDASSMTWTEIKISTLKDFRAPAFEPPGGLLYGNNKPTNWMSRKGNDAPTMITVPSQDLSNERKALEAYGSEIRLLKSPLVENIHAKIPIVDNLKPESNPHYVQHNYERDEEQREKQKQEVEYYKNKLLNGLQESLQSGAGRKGKEKERGGEKGESNIPKGGDEKQRQEVEDYTKKLLSGLFGKTQEGLEQGIGGKEKGIDKGGNQVESEIEKARINKEIDKRLKKIEEEEEQSRKQQSKSKIPSTQLQKASKSSKTVGATAQEIGTTGKQPAELKAKNTEQTSASKPSDVAEGGDAKDNRGPPPPPPPSPPPPRLRGFMNVRTFGREMWILIVWLTESALYYIPLVLFLFGLPAMLMCVTYTRTFQLGDEKIHWGLIPDLWDAFLQFTMASLRKSIDFFVTIADWLRIPLDCRVSAWTTVTGSVTLWFVTFASWWIWASAFIKTFMKYMSDLQEFIMEKIISPRVWSKLPTYNAKEWRHIMRFIRYFGAFVTVAIFVLSTSPMWDVLVTIIVHQILNLGPAYRAFKYITRCVSNLPSILPPMMKLFKTVRKGLKTILHISKVFSSISEGLSGITGNTSISITPEPDPGQYTSDAILELGDRLSLEDSPISTTETPFLEVSFDRAKVSMFASYILVLLFAFGFYMSLHRYFHAWSQVVVEEASLPPDEIPPPAGSPPPLGATGQALPHSSSSSSDGSGPDSTDNYHFPPPLNRLSSISNLLIYTHRPLAILRHSFAYFSNLLTYISRPFAYVRRRLTMFIDYHLPPPLSRIRLPFAYIRWLLTEFEDYRFPRPPLHRPPLISNLITYVLHIYAIVGRLSADTSQQFAQQFLSMRNFITSYRTSPLQGIFDALEAQYALIVRTKEVLLYARDLIIPSTVLLLFTLLGWETEFFAVRGYNPYALTAIRAIRSYF
ncbi:hypothetical protein SBOR_8895 [Sclerotinia borealis F-4128]|uniref:UBC core domain-containing protein n=1 Tax=Sclerotinia borealis (strain F-4128) TaxID=1432307 RepID=W9C836_SCLBF|nr:hypothetical protein SBOR_8895 [Sclerotinia borealis F-4128]